MAYLLVLTILQLLGKRLVRVRVRVRIEVGFRVRVRVRVRPW